MVTRTRERSIAHTPLLSVVIPAQDVEPWIDELVESVLDAGVHDLEVLVIDDHSADGTSERLASMSARDSRVVHHPASSTGAAAARNEGVALARGRYLVFADADDLIPRGAYAALLDSLERSGSDFAIGDHLKFSPTASWRPTSRWFPFDEHLVAVRPVDVPQLVSGRAAWNRMFRRSFWDEAGLRFPLITRTDDIVPMTRAFLAASAIDVLPSCVYLYRDRPGTTSMTAGTPAEVAARLYFQQEAECARRVADLGDSRVSMQYSRLVFDADGWVHLSTYLRQLGPGQSMSHEVAEALTLLLQKAPRSGLATATADRRALFGLVMAGRIEAARAFAIAAARARERRSFDPPALYEWASALAELDGHGEDVLDLPALLVEGPLTALANDAALASELELESAVATLAGVPALGNIDAASVESEILRWMLAAVRSGDSDAVRRVSLARRTIPLVVDHVDAVRDALTLCGPALWPEGLQGAMLALQDDDEILVPLDVTDGRWSAMVSTDDPARPGRWRVRVRLSGGPSIGTQDHDVVTARMPLPPLPPDHLLQPLSDRAKGWVFLIDRRAPSARGLRSRISSRLRRR